MIDEAPEVLSPFDILQLKVNAENSLSSSQDLNQHNVTTASQILQEIKPSKELTKQETEACNSRGTN
ncbi:hypothetical protein DDB_G0282771 [Dictyostelium discoideum AX4]|uniref:Uncharacterized protein n=1 Tax=Dictyostelium discoideum TaxID=44689 RepID=Q54SF0_DICDI|nr:hypothetical protein DDB_G0282771 [Dictyostelium discoideum AX4]EAL66245.1 hypothetical protein DDB_G0282771 [Dictyostelium discoideum AX4]|eukprot:XP_640089.1 hypothetical protein DDB_G0282771 [Dictyostelium discoideum AX4]